MSPATPIFTKVANGQAISLAGISTLPWADFERVILEAVPKELRVVALFAAAGVDASLLYAVLADDREKQLLVGRTQIDGAEFPSLTLRCPQVHLFEREIAEQFGLKPAGHPWFKPVRYHRAWNGRDAWNRPADQPIQPGVSDMYRVEGDQVHEVAVGPVHAGVIEPGHFRFQCHGEQVFHLEIALGYQHRGIEQALIGGPDKRSIHYAETLAGDSTIAHTTAYCQVFEALTGCQPSLRAQTLRGIALELERLANHVGDLGALAGDVGYLPTASYCGRLRGDFLNMTADLCGSRFGRGMIRPGGTGFDMEDRRCEKMLRRLEVAEKDTQVAVELLWTTPSVLARFENTGPVTRPQTLDLGMVGPAARASGLMRDVRHDQPLGIYATVPIPVSAAYAGDVFARAQVRWLEIQQSIRFIREQLSALPAGAIRSTPGPLAPDSCVIALVEGWRGEICHVALTNPEGRFHRYKVVDPSFHNWSGLAMALRSQEISDFPLCNKSFNLSYCGHDL